MKRIPNRILSILIGVFTCCHVAALGQPPTNALNNPGFEVVEGDEVSNWHTPEYWSGSVGPVSQEDTARSGHTPTNQISSTPTTAYISPTWETVSSPTNC